MTVISYLSAILQNVCEKSLAPEAILGKRWIILAWTVLLPIQARIWQVQKV